MQSSICAAKGNKLLLLRNVRSEHLAVQTLHVTVTCYSVAYRLTKQV